MVKAQGSMRKELDKICLNLDENLKNNKNIALAYSKLEELEGKPKIECFSIGKEKIKVGESVKIHLAVDNSRGENLRYFWNVTGGGIEKDPDGNWLYYGSEEGQNHTITLEIVNENNVLRDCDVQSIEVVQKNKGG